MSGTSKRSRSHRENNADNKNQKRRTNEKDENGSDEVIIYRILCPDGVIGSVIGKSGKVINSIRQETRSKVKVMDPFPGCKDRVITVYCYIKEKREVEVDEEFSDGEPLCAAQDGLLRVHAAIVNSITSAAESDKKRGDKEDCQILVPSSQSANIIGKAGSTIKKLRSRTRANIKVSAKDPTDPTHSCAMEFDNFVQISGEPEAVKKALFAVSAIMYKFAPKEEIPLDAAIPEAPPSIIIPSDVPIYQAGGLFPGSDSILPPRSFPPVLGGTLLPELRGYGDTGTTWPIYSSTLPIISGYGGSPQSEELSVRVLCPFDKIGRVIGKGGNTIKNIRQTSGANVEVDDTKHDRNECIITVTATESPDDIKSMAVEAVLSLQSKINDEDEDRVTIRILVPAKVIGCIIGKSGSIINEIRKRTKADVRISKGDKPKCASANDELVEIVGEAGSVRDALVQIILRLRDDALKDKDACHNASVVAESVYSGSAVPPVLSSISSVAPLSYEKRTDSGSGFGMLSSNKFYGYGSLSMGDSSYGSVPSYSPTMYRGLPSPSTLEMVVPANSVGRVMGKGGANVANMRKISGAVIDISESKSSRGDRIAYISGTPDQKRAAQNLIEAFIMAT